MTEEELQPAAEGPARAALHEERPARFMVIVAHPDDADFGPAATAAKWIQPSIRTASRVASSASR